MRKLLDKLIRKVHRCEPEPPREREGEYRELVAQNRRQAYTIIKQRELIAELESIIVQQARLNK